MLLNTGCGKLVAAALRYSWRDSSSLPSGFSCADLDAVTPLLYDSGAAGLGWWRIRESSLGRTPSGELLHQAFRLLTLQAAIHQKKIEKVFRVFGAADIDPILVKGWAVARLYPQPGLRPYGDIDLIIRRDDLRAATEIAASDELRDCAIDLHPGCPFELADRSIDDLYLRSQLVQCGNEDVRLLSAEDHLALISVHLLKHAAWRPLWLCDVALIIETAPAEFDWQVCLGRDKRRVNWILSTVGLARALLQATPSSDEIATRAVAPQWLIESVLKNWAQPFIGKHEPHNHRAEIKTYLAQPRGLFSDLKRRWPDPILSTVFVNGSFGHRQRLRYQFRNCLNRAVHLLRPAAARST